MTHKRYPSNVSDAEWAVVEGLLPAAKPSGRPQKVKGRRRYIRVDSLGLLVKVLLTEANIQDREAALWLWSCVAKRLPRLTRIMADAAYQGDGTRYPAEHRVQVEIVKRHAPAHTFQVVPRRWVVERTFAWLSHQRRLSKDYEYLVQNPAMPCVTSPRSASCYGVCRPNLTF